MITHIIQLEGHKGPNQTIPVFDLDIDVSVDIQMDMGINLIPQVDALNTGVQEGHVLV